jgi:septal ring factor EnvC (AmiA/AmiB activator)
MVLVIAIPALAQVTDEEIEDARAEVNAIFADSQDLAADVQAAWAMQSSLEEEIASLEASIELAKAQIADSKERLEEVAVEMYMGSASSATLQILFSLSTGQYEAGTEYLRNVSGDQAEIVNQLRSYRSELDRQTERLAEAVDEQKVVNEDLAEMSAQLQADLEEAQAMYEQLVAQQAAEEAAAATSTSTSTSTTSGSTETTSGATTTTSGATTTTQGTTTTTSGPPPPSGNGACPVAGVTWFTDTFGDPRSGGRTHEGVDMMAAHMTPVVAIYSGTISFTSGSLSGNAIWLNSNAGDSYFYAHLDSFADVNSGQKVTEGQVIGFVGDTGNAPPGVYHLHFEFHPGGGAAVNPYPLVKGLC